MAFFKEIKKDELYLYMNGKLIYKRWLKTGQSKVFDVMAYDKYTLMSIRGSKLIEKEQFLSDHIYCGLTNLNNGFDSERIYYFSEDDFKVVLQRCEQFGIGIYGIEPWLDGGIYDVKTYEDYSNSPVNPKWYQKAFNEFLKKKKDLQYAASYYVPQTEDNL